LENILLDFDTAAKTRRMYVLENGLPMRCNNPFEWVLWMFKTPRNIAVDRLPNENELVTLFAGYEGEKRLGEALTFCTIIKPDPQMPEYALVQNWYATEQEAIAGHQAILHRLTTGKTAEHLRRNQN
jgi:hypothetical protein